MTTPESTEHIIESERDWGIQFHPEVESQYRRDHASITAAERAAVRDMDKLIGHLGAISNTSQK